MSTQLIEKMLMVDEGLRLTPYLCTALVPTIGYGRTVGKKGDPLPNITTTKEKELVFLRQRIQEIQQQLLNKYSNIYFKLNATRQAVLVCLVYQLGLLGAAKFKLMWQALQRLDWDEAAKQMLDSLWAKQTPNRAKRLSEQMRTGVVHEYYK